MVTNGVPRGALVLVGTPIGNLDDLTPRAAAALAAADLIACEDTRRTGRLLAHLGIGGTRLVVVNDHTEATVARGLADRVVAGERIVVVTDAGMPGISDPGEDLVRAVLAVGGAVEVVPGPSALDAAVALSGLATGRFCFEGFLPRKGSARRQRLDALAREERTTVLYEAPHRLERTLEDLERHCGPDRHVALLREITKLHEEHWRGTLDDARAHIESHEPRGEFVVVLGGAPRPPEVTDATIGEALAEARAGGATTRDAVIQVAESHGVARRRVYRLAHESVRHGNDEQADEQIDEQHDRRADDRDPR